VTSHLSFVSLVDNTFQKLKDRSHEVLNTSRDKIEEVSDELRDEYNIIEKDRLQYEADLKKATENNTTPPPTEGIELRDTEQLTTDLETERANLEMNLNTNPGVIEQYEKRKKEVSRRLFTPKRVAVLTCGI
jgi:structural maintenance of chromosomes protein 5